MEVSTSGTLGDLRARCIVGGVVFFLFIMYKGGI